MRISDWSSDVCSSDLIWVKLDKFRHQATLDLRVDYLRPATPGKTIIGRGECYRVTKSVGFVRGLAHDGDNADPVAHRSEEHTSELQSLMRLSYAVFCLKKKKTTQCNNSQHAKD